MLLLVIGLVVIICWRYRATGDPSEGSQNTGNNVLEAMMIGIPALLLGWFFFQSGGIARAIAPAGETTAKPDVIITGHQWWWEVAYPGHDVITANEVHLPVGKHLLMEMRSGDVIHDWWVPALGNKTDLVPGNKTYLSLDIVKPGDYSGACSEFCGAQHAWMRIRVVAQLPEDFAIWLAANAKPALPPVGQPVQARGRPFPGHDLRQLPPDRRHFGHCERGSRPHARGKPQGIAHRDTSHGRSRSEVLDRPSPADQTRRQDAGFYYEQGLHRRDSPLHRTIKIGFQNLKNP